MPVNVDNFPNDVETLKAALKYQIDTKLTFLRLNEKLHRELDMVKFLLYTLTYENGWDSSSLTPEQNTYLNNLITETETLRCQR